MTDLMITSAAAEEAKTEAAITDPVDRAMVLDMGGVSKPETPALDEATIKLLTELGFDHVPTIEEAKSALDARREFVRSEVLFQADRKQWCEDGTREVCANLRLRRPGSRTEKKVTVRATVEYTVHRLAYSDRGALHSAEKSGYLPVGTRFAAGGLVSAEIHELKVDDTVIDLTDELRKEITDV